MVDVGTIPLRHGLGATASSQRPGELSSVVAASRRGECRCSGRRVSAGRPRPYGDLKRPVEGRRLVRRLNIEGDGQGDLAGHGGEHRAVLWSWAARLSPPSNDLRRPLPPSARPGRSQRPRMTPPHGTLPRTARRRAGAGRVGERREPHDRFDPGAEAEDVASSLRAGDDVAHVAKAIAPVTTEASADSIRRPDPDSGVRACWRC